MLDIRLLTPADCGVLDRVADDTFDHAIKPKLAAEFLNDSRHHVMVALDDGLVVGFVSAVHYMHPDKPAELWINEVPWVVTNRSNTAAMRLYASCGGSEGDDDLTMFSFPLKPA